MEEKRLVPLEKVLEIVNNWEPDIGTHYVPKTLVEDRGYWPSDYYITNKEQLIDRLKELE